MAKSRRRRKSRAGGIVLVLLVLIILGFGGWKICRIIGPNTEEADIADLFGVRIADGKAVFIEVKTPKGRPTKQQKNFLSKMRAYGAISGVCRSAEEAIQLITEQRR